jgi:hypothetical protein
MVHENGYHHCILLLCLFSTLCFFPYGDKGFYVGMKYVGPDDVLPEGRSTVSMMKYYSYRCHYRRGQVNPYLCCDVEA